MASTRSSRNYVWDTGRILGQGATGTVYQGACKSTGRAVAVKTFNASSRSRPIEVQMREFEVLKKVQHANVVELLAIEESNDDGRVIVMELCSGGSLLDVLERPENAYGLEESEFLRFLGHLVEGVRYLRNSDLVHRDLKPGNIMRFTCEDGSSVYKLADFGSARELQEGQEFVSLYGTEEYLHPDMYESAVLRKQCAKKFDATVDLWSLGVTLYHAATGRLPFRPYGGRQNRKGMHLITSQKQVGIISGVQSNDKAFIHWSRELPDDCQLSNGLKKFLTPLLAGLLEKNPEHVWSFERLFNEVTDFLSRKVIHVYHLTRASVINVYLPHDQMDELQTCIAEQTQIEREFQVLLFEDKLLNRECCETTEEKPVVLFNKDDNNIATKLMANIPSFPKISNLTSVTDLKAACRIGYVCLKRIEKMSLADTLTKYSANCFINHINNTINSLISKCMHLKDLIVSLELTCDTLHLSQRAINVDAVDLSVQLQNCSKMFLEDVFPKVQQLHQKGVVPWKTSPTDAPRKAKMLVEQLAFSWRVSCRNQHISQLDRMRMAETIGKLDRILEDDAIAAFQRLINNLSDWCKSAQTVYLQTVILAEDVARFEVDLRNFWQGIIVSKKRHEQIVQRADSSGGKLESSVKKLEKQANELRNLVDDNANAIERIKSLEIKPLQKF